MLSSPRLKTLYFLLLVLVALHICVCYLLFHTEGLPVVTYNEPANDKGHVHSVLIRIIKFSTSDNAFLAF